MKQHFFLRGEWIGSREIPTWSTLDPQGGPRVNSSYVLFCPKCADIWGKMMHEAEGAYCQIVNSHCVEHAGFPSDATFSAPFAEPGQARNFAGMPEAVQRHDVAALCSFYSSNPTKFYYEPIELPETAGA